MRRQVTWISLVGIVLSSLTTMAAAEQPARPKRAVLLIIDGLHWQAPQRLGLKNIQTLAREGASFEQAWLVPPAHPVTGPWAELYKSSIPNEVMLAGTVFITKDHRLIQDVFFPGSAHVNNYPAAYVSLNRGNQFIRAKQADDAWAIDQALELLKSEPVTFMRIHLQDTGLAGYNLHLNKDVPEAEKDIWANGSAYVAKAREADRQLGRFVRGLKEMGKYDDTLLVVTADHGQAKTGWHPPEIEESAITPLIFVGPGIAKNRVLPYANHIDIVPTICHIMGREKPNYIVDNGEAATEILASNNGIFTHPPRQYMKEINAVWQNYLALCAKAEKRSDPAVAQALARAKDAFYTPYALLDWPKAGTMDGLIDHNRAVVADLRKALAVGQGGVWGLMHKVNDWQLAHQGKAEDRDWNRATWYTGVMAAYKATGDEQFLQQAMNWGKTHQWQVGAEYHGANKLFCVQTWLELYFVHKDKAMLEPTVQWLATPAVNTPAGDNIRWRWHAIPKRFGYQDLVYPDALYGAPALAMLAKATGDPKYLDILHRFFWDVAGELYDKDDHLFYWIRIFIDHGPETRIVGYLNDGRHGKASEAHPQYTRTENGKKVIWSRGTGWAYGALARILEYLPENDLQRPRYVQMFREMSAELAKRQGADGLWRTNLDDPQEYPMKESTGTCFFCYGMAWGINHGLLDRDTYLPVVKKAWAGVVGCISPEGKPEWGQKASGWPEAVEQQDTREYVTGTFLLAASEMYRLEGK